LFFNESGVVFYSNIRIHVHSYACVCIHMHFIVFCMHSDALHSTIWLHSNAFCNHFELLHSSDARRLHSDAFSYLLHSRHVTFWCIFMHPEGPLHVDAFATWCIRGVTHCNAFWCSCNSCILVHSDYGAFICIIVHLQCVAFYMSCIQMHLYASPHKVHSVDTLHSDALAFLRIQAHSDAFTHTRIH
jgi:hypothetical protein